MRSRIIQRGLFVALGGIIAVLLSVAVSVTPAVAQCSLNYGFNPNYGQRTLSTGFGSYSTSVYIGGGCSARYLGGNCTGYATSQPDFRVFYNGPGNRTLRISATSSADSTLIVNSATGRWLCDDDSGPGVNPLISINNAPSGQYDIWVGAYSQGNSGVSGSLRIEESGSSGGGSSGGGIPSNRNYPPVGAYLLTGGRGLTNGAWMAPGEFQVEWYCEQRGYRANYDWSDWFCQTSGGSRAFTLSVSDFDAICRATYNNPGAFAIRDGYNQRPAFNWRCYGY